MSSDQTRKCPECGKDVVPKVKYEDDAASGLSTAEKTDKTMRIESYFVCPNCGARLA